MAQADVLPGASQTRFEVLVQPHLGRLLRFAGRRLRNLADAEDVVQEACSRAWLAFADLRDETLVLPWLYRILRSSLSDQVGTIAGDNTVLVLFADEPALERWRERLLVLQPRDGGQP